MVWGTPNFEGGGEAPIFEGGTNFGRGSWVGGFWGWTDVGGPLECGECVGGKSGG